MTPGRLQWSSTSRWAPRAFTRRMSGESTDAPAWRRRSGLVGQLLDRLQLEHGDVLVAVALGCLAAARNGLAEDELVDLLSANPSRPAETHAGVYALQDDLDLALALWPEKP